FSAERLGNDTSYVASWELVSSTWPEPWARLPVQAVVAVRVGMAASCAGGTLSAGNTAMATNRPGARDPPASDQGDPPPAAGGRGQGGGADEWDRPPARWERAGASLG